MPVFLTLFLALTGFLSSTANAQEILILGKWGDLYSIDPKNGIGSLVGYTGEHTYLWNGLAVDSQGRLFAATGDDWVGFSIYEIDPNTGLGTFVVQTDLFGLNSMAFDSNDKLYVSNDRYFPASGSPFDLYTMDLATGTSTFIGETQMTEMHAMDFYEDTLYAYAEHLGLITLSTSDGSATDVNPNFRGPWLSTTSICFNDEGVLFYLDSLLWIMDREKGTAAPIDWMVPNGYWGEAVFVEGSNPQFALWLVGTAGHYMGIKMSGATPNGQVGVAWTKGDGGPTPIPSGFPCAGAMMDLNSNMQELAFVNADADGFATVGPIMVHPSAAGLVYIQAIDVTTCVTSNRVLLHY